MDRTCKLSQDFQFSFDERLVDDHFGGGGAEFAPLLGLDLFSHRFKVLLHPVNPDRDTVNQRERLESFASTGVNTLGTMFPDSGFRGY